MNLTVIKAIFKRDFTSYFANPTGYVFICAFVMLSALAAFWPPEFFNNNLANLDQLSRWMPFILLVFIPAISMSTWAEERRQGTDELLLTLPASDLDVVVGKYKAVTAIFTVSLLFSMFAIFLVFGWGLGRPDWGLFLSTYLGYWFIGLAMLAVGMVASFLTRNLTVGFVLGALLNAPLAIAGVADWVVKDRAIATLISRWSAASQFADFQRGIISLSSIVFFVSVAITMLYLCMVLIGKRHWGTGQDGDSRWGHYLVRVLCLLAVVGGLNVLLSSRDPVRFDVTGEKLNSLSAGTVKLIRDLRANKDQKPIVVDAYVSPTVPTEYAEHRLNLLGTLAELKSRSGGLLQVNTYEIETFSPEADIAERQYGIEPRAVQTTSRGVVTDEEIFMGLAVTSGLDKVVVPFLDKGVPVEYELVRSIATVADQKRKRIGVLKTGCELFGGFSMQGPTEKSQLVIELEKQYDVVEVDPTEPITETYDALLAVQPSSLSPEAMRHFLAALRRGQPVAIFEDPLPAMFQVAGTAQPNRQNSGPMAMFGGGGEVPKGDITPVWQLLGVSLYGNEVVLQDFYPYPEYRFSHQFVFIDEANAGIGIEHPFGDENPISANLRQVLFLRTGRLRQADGAKLKFEPLAVTTNNTATFDAERLQMANPFDQLDLELESTGQPYILAAAIRGEVEDDEDLELKAPGTADQAKEGQALRKIPINAVVVADIDCLGDAFFQLRAQGERGLPVAELNFQNVTFVLNVLDFLAGDDRFIDIRKRTRSHRRLENIDNATQTYRDQFRKQTQEFVDDAKKQIAAAGEEFTGAIEKLEARTDLDPRTKEILVERERIRLGAKRDAKVQSLENDRSRKLRQGQRELEQQIRSVQDRYKLLSVILPPIPPILLGIFVFFHRRAREREGVSKSRLRFASEDQAKKP